MDGVYASADIGSNTVHLLVAEVRKGQVRRLENASHWLSLGEVVGKTGSIPKPLVAELASKVQEFSKTAATARARGFYLFATEAIRSASNQGEVLSQVERVARVKVDVISARREAELAWLGVHLDAVGLSPALFLEVGGGSAQVAVCVDDRIVSERSLPLGTGRLIADNGLSFPCTDRALEGLRKEVDQWVSGLEDVQPVATAVASGGVARGVWRALHPDGERTLHRDELDYLIRSLPRLSLDTIGARFGVKPQRAQTLLPGSMVLGAILDRFCKSEMTVSQFGVREGAVLEMARGKIRL